MKTAVSLIVFAAFAALAADKPVLVPEGSVQVQAQKWWFEKKSGDNLDQIWGRINFGGSLNLDNFEAKIKLRVYPAGLGYEVLTGSVKWDTANSQVVTKSQSIAKVQIPEAWFMAKMNNVRLKIGAMEVGNTLGGFFGNYTDDPVNGGWYSRIPTVHSMELTYNLGISTTQINLIANDMKLNKGDLRIFETLSIMKNWNFGAGYRGNIFDLAHDNNAELSNAIDLQTDFTPVKDVTLFTEFGIVDLTNDNNKTRYPLLVGVSLPGFNILDQIQMELEFLNRDQENFDNVMWNLYLKKKIINKIKIEGGIFSIGKASEVGIATRITGSL